MTQLICKLKNGENIIIELLYNPFMEEWIRQFNLVNQFCEVDQHFFSPISYDNEWNQKIIENNEEKIKESIRNLNNLGTEFPIQEEEVSITNDSSGRDLLNRLHRHFTTGHRTAVERKNFTWLENSNLNFNLQPKDYNEFAKWVHLINDYVHSSERYFVNSRKTNFPMTKEWLVLFTSQTYRGQDSNFKYFLTIKDEHFEYFSDDMTYDMWLPLSQIQGKNYLQGYVDEDDPRHWDISANIFYSGSFSLGDRSWYHSQEIQNYLKSYGMFPSSKHCGMPLGKIASGKKLLENIDRNKIKSMHINE